MEDGRPSKLDNPLPATEVEKEKPADPIENRLKFSTTWKATPSFAGQARMYPDTVRVVDERYYSLDTSNKEDMDQFSKIQLSSDADSTYRITERGAPVWSEARKAHVILLCVQQREFKSMLTSQTDPSEI